ncbi:hypothetical protein F2Q70_00025768 [Brassica cretica]|uniref:Uncharacterized protein n=1 Tax=Brassica cretica TaxID=69181 RepID=A0A8S9LIC1_BRACR|nr:hypothetical protein F2Q70_00025768 [Brassica cretica]
MSLQLAKCSTNLSLRIAKEAMDLEGRLMYHCKAGPVRVEPNPLHMGDLICERSIGVGVGVAPPNGGGELPLGAFLPYTAWRRASWRTSAPGLSTLSLFALAASPYDAVCGRVAFVPELGVSRVGMGWL